MISRRTIVFAALCISCMTIPVAYTDGRVYEGRKLAPNDYVATESALNAFPIVFIRTLVGGEPESLRMMARFAVLLIGCSLISFAFDFAPLRKVQIRPSHEKDVSQETDALLEETPKAEEDDRAVEQSNDGHG